MSHRTRLASHARLRPSRACAALGDTRALALAVLAGTSLIACGESFATATSSPGSSGHAGSTGSGGQAGSSSGGASATGGNAGSGGSGGSAGSGVDSGAAGGAGTGSVDAGPPPCGASCTDLGFTCCSDGCSDLSNNPLSCGKCGNACPSATPYCSNGVCGPPPCAVAGSSCASGLCCGQTCCTSSQICCNKTTPTSSTPTCSTPTLLGGCPLVGVCAAPNTPILTPTGERPIASLRVGDLVMSLDQGRLVAVPVRAARSVPVVGHHVVRVTLASGRVLEVSGPHPTADGRRLDELVPGTSLSGAEAFATAQRPAGARQWLGGAAGPSEGGPERVVALETVPYGYSHTHDILPDSDSGVYLAGGVWLGSTLRALTP